MDKFLKQICLANDIDPESDNAAELALDIFTGNNSEPEPEPDVEYVCGNCYEAIDVDPDSLRLPIIRCPHCGTINTLNKP